MKTIAQPLPAVVVLDGLAQKYAAARSTVGERVSALNDELRQVRDRHLQGIKRAAAVAGQLRSDLAAAVTSHPELFEKPQSMTLHGFKLGYKKGAGKISWEVEDELLIKRLRKQFSEEELELILSVKTTVSKDALKTLDAKVLASLGVEVEGTGNYVFVKGADTEIDKLVAKILKEDENEAVEAAAE